MSNSFSMKYYKVVSPLESEVIIDTNLSNYSQTLNNKNQYEKLLSLVTSYSAIYNLPLDFFFNINNGLALFGDSYLQQMPRSVNRKFELFSITKNPNHKNYYIEEGNLIAFVENLIALGIMAFQEGFYLWEYICEAIRQIKHVEKPRREDSFFLFDSIENCKYYIETHNFPGEIASVEIVSGTQPFKADMKQWDMIPNHATLLQAERLMDHYWQGQTSSTPIFEYLFQGICRLSPL